MGIPRVVWESQVSKVVFDDWIRFIQTLRLTSTARLSRYQEQGFGTYPSSSPATIRLNNLTDGGCASNSVMEKCPLVSMDMNTFAP